MQPAATSNIHPPSSAHTVLFIIMPLLEIPETTSYLFAYFYDCAEWAAGLKLKGETNCCIFSVFRRQCSTEALLCH